MRKTIGIILAGVLCLCSCNREHEVRESAPEKDSVAKVVTGWLLQENYERATEVIDSADAAGWLTPFDAQMLRLRVVGRDERCPGYVDFYTGHAYAFITYAYASLGRMDEAKTYSRLFDTTNYSRTYAGRKHMVSGWCMLGEYNPAKLIKMINPQEC